MSLPRSDVEVTVKAEATKAVIEGKTPVPFKVFVGLVLQRKVLPLFKDWGKEPVIMNSELLTAMASAPQDSQENRQQLILVTLGVGMLFGVFSFTIFQIILLAVDIPLGMQELFLFAGGLFAIALLTVILMRIQERTPRAQKVTDMMEKVSGLLSK